MNAEHLLVCSVLAFEDLTPVLEREIVPGWFDNQEDRDVFEYILQHWSRYGKVPSRKVVRSNFPSYRLVKPREPYEFYVDRLCHQREYRILFEGATKLAEALEDDDVDAAKNAIATSLRTAHTEVSHLRDTDVISTWQERLERYAELKKYGHELKGIPTGFPTVDASTRGLQGEQLITFIGLPKSGKTWFMLAMALAAHQAGNVPLFLSFEMSTEELEERQDAMVAGISYGRLRKGQTTRKEDERLAQKLRRRRHEHPFLISSDPEGTTVSAIAAKIEQYQPAIVFVDGVYLMDDEEGEPKGSPQALTNITRSFKRLARRLKIPIVISTQVLGWKVNRKKGIDENSVGYSSSFAQDSDLILGTETPGDDPEDPIKLIRVVLARNIPRFQTAIHWDWETTSYQELRDLPDGDGNFGADVSDSDEEEVTEDVWDPSKKVVRRAERKG